MKKSILAVALLAATSLASAFQIVECVEPESKAAIRLMVGETSAAISIKGTSEEPYRASVTPLRGLLYIHDETGGIFYMSTNLRRLALVDDDDSTVFICKTVLK